MKLKKTLFGLLFSVVALATISSCGNNTTGKSFEAYSDCASFKAGNIDFAFTGLNEYSVSGNYRVGFTLELINRNTKAQKITINNALYIRESNGAEYSNNSFAYNIPYILECDIKQTISFSTTLPTSYKNDKYSLRLSYNSSSVVFHLYNKPNELKKQVEVKYEIDGAIVKTKKLLEGDTFGDFYWESSDYIYGCKNWYYDSNYQSIVRNTDTISYSLTIYGSKQIILKYNLPESASSSFVSGYNFIPPTGEIVIPRSYSGRKVHSILAGAFMSYCGGLIAIYIPKTVKISDAYNFYSCMDLEYVYFEGTQYEWEEMNEAQYPSKTQIIFNRYK